MDVLQLSRDAAEYFLCTTRNGEGSYMCVIYVFRYLMSYCLRCACTSMMCDACIYTYLYIYVSYVLLTSLCTHTSLTSCAAVYTPYIRSQTKTWSAYDPVTSHASPNSAFILKLVGGYQDSPSPFSSPMLQCRRIYSMVVRGHPDRN